ncbi:hypothetical protein ACLB2K_068778 [Fragaria x ananassa]
MGPVSSPEVAGIGADEAEKFRTKFLKFWAFSGIFPEMADAKRFAAIKEKVDRLLENESIREVDYPQWMSNIVMVEKSNRRWRMCVDYTHLNKACPSDSFPLPRIHQLVDSIAEHKLLCFMDTYSSYNQILLHEEDQEHTSFITDKSLYCYRVMPFRLKNAGATY